MGFNLAEEVTLFLSLCETGQVAVDYQVRDIQPSVKPAAGWEKSLPKTTERLERPHENVTKRDHLYIMLLTINGSMQHHIEQLRC